MGGSKIPTEDSNENKDGKQKKDLQQKQIQFVISYIIVSFLGMWLFQQFILTPLVIRETQIPYSEFKAKIAAGEIVDATLGQDRIGGTMKNPDMADTKKTTIPFTTNAVPGGDQTLIPALD